MDVYFAALKYESVEQLKEYEAFNFLSKFAMYTGGHLQAGMHTRKDPRTVKGTKS